MKAKGGFLWVDGMAVLGLFFRDSLACAPGGSAPPLLKWSAPVFEGEAFDAAEVFGVVGDDGPLMTQAGGGDKDIGDADRRALVE